MTASVTFFPEVILRRFLQLLQHHGRDFRGSEFLVVDLHAGIVVDGCLHLVRHHATFFGNLGKTASHEAFDRINRFLGIGHRLAPGDLSHKTFAVLGESYNGGRDAVAFAIGDNGGFTAFHHRHDRVGGSQINSDDLAHDVQSSCRRPSRK